MTKKHLRWKKGLPRVTPFYAVKCNDSWPILKTLASLGTGFDCASKVIWAKYIILPAVLSKVTVYLF